jgi:hypothetical protein
MHSRMALRMLYIGMPEGFMTRRLHAAAAAAPFADSFAVPDIGFAQAVAERSNFRAKPR